MHNKKLEAIFDDLENGVRAIFESPNYKHYLEVMARFHNYSSNNWRLIYKQCPNATRVAGYKQWKENFDRYVRKGEKAIRIIAPHKDYGFIEVFVFDVSQTEGNPLPSDGIVAYQLNNDIKNYNALYKILVKISPLPIYFEKLNGPNGICYLGNKILINKGMSEAQNLKTIIHEIAHEILHNNSTAPKKTKEVEAESVAYAVCSYLGIDTSSYSFGYIAGYSRNQSTKILLASLDRITKATKSLIHQIREELGLSNEEIVWEYDISQSLYEKGLQYYTNPKKDNDYVKAFRYFLEAAIYGHEKAIYKVATCYKNGIGTDKNIITAINWYMKIKDNQYAQYAIGYLTFYYHKNQQDALTWFLRSAKQGNIAGIYYVGLYFMHGYGKTKKDYQKALKLFLYVANKGHSRAQYMLGLCYKNGYGTEKNEEEAFKWFLKAAEQGYVNACYEIARSPKSSKNISFDYLLKAAKQGHRIAQYEIGNHYYNGDVVTQNYTAAFIWYLDSAKQNYSNAQYMLGLCYKNGYGTKVSFEESFKYFHLVAYSNKNNLSGAAMYELANYYSEGLGVEKDLSKAFDLYQNAISCGYTDAKLNLSQFYLNGIKTEKNIEKGVELLLSAIQNGNDEAKEIVVGAFVTNDNYKSRTNQSLITEIKNGIFKFWPKFLKR